MVRCLWGFLCREAFFRHEGGACAIDIMDHIETERVPLTIPPPSIILYLDGDAGDSAEVQLITQRPTGPDLLPMASFPVEFQRRGGLTYVITEVGLGRDLILPDWGIYRVQTKINGIDQVQFQFQVVEGIPEEEGVEETP